MIEVLHFENISTGIDPAIFWRLRISQKIILCWYLWTIFFTCMSWDI